MSSPRPRSDLPNPTRSLRQNQENLLIRRNTRSRRQGRSSSSYEPYNSYDICWPANALVELEGIGGHEFDRDEMVVGGRFLAEEERFGGDGDGGDEYEVTRGGSLDV